MAQSKRKPQISTIERGHQTILMDGWDFSRVKFFVDSTKSKLIKG